jgi:hypothetical protein
LLDVPDDQGRFPLGLVLDEADQLGLGRLAGEPGDALQLSDAFGVLAVQFGGAALEVVPALVQGERALLVALEFLVKALFAVGQPYLAALQVARP